MTDINGKVQVYVNGKDIAVDKTFNFNVTDIANRYKPHNDSILR